MKHSRLEKNMKPTNYTELNKCLCCDNDKLRTVLDLNDQPLANSYLDDPEKDEELFPLKLNYCSKCTHLQLSVAVNPDLLFRDYLYVSGTSRTLHEFFKDFVKLTESYLPENNRKVLDIACNDGTLLDYYQDAGYETYGIDPSVNLYEISSKRHNVELDYLNQDYADKHKDEFDIIVAQNVMAHNSYPKEFLEMCRDMVTDEGFIFIQTSQGDMVENNEFDTIYHEHLSFFSLESFDKLAESAGLSVVFVERPAVHGNSLLFILSKTHAKSDFKNTFYLDDETVDNYAKKCIKATQDLNDGLNRLKAEGYTIIGYGAAAKGNTLLNFGKINLDYIVDDNPLKQELYTPGMRIPICSPETLAQEKGKVCIVPLAWNFYKEIVEKSNELLDTKDKVFVRYFPEYKEQIL